MCRIYQEHASQVDVQIYQEHASQVDIRYIYYEQVIEGFVQNLLNKEQAFNPILHSPQCFTDTE